MSYSRVSERNEENFCVPYIAAGLGISLLTEAVQVVRIFGKILGNLFESVQRFTCVKLDTSGSTSLPLVLPD